MPIPTPWIRAYDVPGEFGRGYGLGLQTEQFNVKAQMDIDQAAERNALAREELDRRERQVALQTQTQKEIAEKQLRLHQAQADITRAYHEAQIGIQRDRLKQEEDLMNWRISEAATSRAAEETYNKRRAELEASGLDPVLAGIRAALQTPGFTRRGSEVASLGGAEARLMNVPEAVAGGTKAYPVEWANQPGTFVPNTFRIPGRGGRDVIRSITGAPAAEQSEFISLREREKQIMETLNNARMAGIEKMDPSEAKDDRQRQFIIEQQRRAQDLREELEEIRAERRRKIGQFAVPGAAPASAPTHTWDPNTGRIVPIR